MEDVADLDAQIAALQAVKQRKLAKAAEAQRAKDAEAARILVGSTPVKSKVRKIVDDVKPSQPIFPTKPKKPLPVLPDLPRKASTMTTALALHRSTAQASSSKVDQVPTKRSAAFSEGGKGKGRDLVVEERPSVQRDDELMLVEKLELGPREFGRDPEGEQEWRNVEPNSGIRLSKRMLPHADVQSHLYGRYHLSPSQIYSVIRLSKDGSTYDIPVDGDWLTIAVVAERGDIRVSGTKQAEADLSDGEDGVPVEGAPNADEKKKWSKKRGPRKYINFKLAAMGPRSKISGGDALLQLLLFEADSVVRSEETTETGEVVVTKDYRGGSGGAYEKWCNLGVGSVVALLNPRVLRPLKSGAQAPHPLTLPLALNPTSGDGVLLIGQSRDLGCCTAMQKDGKRCQSWVDLRQNQVCDYHVHAAIKKGRSGRAEFTASTASYALSARDAKIDPRKKTGLLPRSGAMPAPRAVENGGGGATYIVGGGVVRTGILGGHEFLSEKLGRRRGEKRKRQMEEKETEESLKRLLERDGKLGSTGAQYLMALAKRKGKGKEREIPGATEQEPERRRPFNAEAIKRIGYDPTHRAGNSSAEEVARKLQSISSLKDQLGRKVQLGRPPGQKTRSVFAPLGKKGTIKHVDGVTQGDEEEEEGMVDLD
ncbi:minichromosome maintenance protein 10, partial [Tremellales sp. Uapishka_1]